MVSAWLRMGVVLTALLFFGSVEALAKTVFLGGSQTAGWKYSGDFKDVVNKATVSNTTSKILKGLGPVVALKPEKVFILEGVNELWSANASILTRYREILRRIHQGSPKTLIFVQSVLPVVNRPDLSNEKITELNAGLKALCAEVQNCIYIDLFSHFAVNGALNESLTTDGVHLRPDGYKLWHALIEKYVALPNDQLTRPETLAGLGAAAPATN
ncbi:lipolytic protein G-D-S-L family [Solidesulfovibrio carbinoliphilus subsp. oakridgensis]|uniref:Lipolytic protein G-D-S-L family n=1 Tax=Solidesulfovibrio carbinoliphilus subsp. oakridgensis TaxID=694327 RepID=G7Q792_9BACT|nr:GDSL-type esterase/lipase family protein [Solidesulfovibrio carbinoliphilus]EHJ49049.1 lipolytic protein G-D-S-L family [Solidesulfovibrio carbinoliphilus subsp. oakridgensis]